MCDLIFCYDRLQTCLSVLGSLTCLRSSDTAPMLDLNLLDISPPPPPPPPPPVPPPAGTNWGLFSWDFSISQRFSACGEERSWREISRSDLWVSDKPNGRTGGLGRLMVLGQFEVWLCLDKPQCISQLLASPEHQYMVDQSSTSPWQNFMCYVYNEDTSQFIPWASESALLLLGFLSQR